MLDLSSDPLTAKEAIHLEGPLNESLSKKGPLNERASYFSGHDIYGDAILASIGYTWKSKDLSYEDVSVQSYYRSAYFTELVVLPYSTF